MPCVYNDISTESEVQIPNMSCQFKESFDAALPWHCIVGKKWDPGSKREKSPHLILVGKLGKLGQIRKVHLKNLETSSGNQEFFSSK